jgi:hypothetical protein
MEAEARLMILLYLAIPMVLYVLWQAIQALRKVRRAVDKMGEFVSLMIILFEQQKNNDRDT